MLEPSIALLGHAAAGAALQSLGLAAAQLAVAGVELAAHVVVSVTALIMCITVHEFGHAWVADRMGDPLPRQQGRVTLNPLRHIDPLGTVIFPALMALGASIPLAWGKPVQWTGHPAYLTRRFSMRTIRFFVAVAGPAMNLVLALLISVAYLVFGKLGMKDAMRMCAQLIAMNFGLMFFNLLPIPPLDGRVFLEYLPNSLAVVRDTLSRYGSFIFLALILLGGVGGVSPLGYIMMPFHLLTGLYLMGLRSLVG